MAGDGWKRWINRVLPESAKEKENTRRKKLFWETWRELQNYREVLPAHKESIALIRKTDPERAWKLTLKWHDAYDEIIDRLSAVGEWE